MKKIQHVIPAKKKLKTSSLEEWKSEAKNRYGENSDDWKFECPHCHQTQSKRDFKDNDVEPEGRFYFSCIGRWVEGRGCNWTLGGLFQIHTREVIAEDGSKVPVFDFPSS